MAERKGKLLDCDRCGKSTFLKLIGEGEADGGFTRWDKFERMPEGWGFIDTNNSMDRIALLCDNCSKEYMKMFKEFMKNGKDNSI